MDLRADPFQKTLATAIDTALTGTRDAAVELAAVGVPEMSLSEKLGGYGLGLGADVVVHHRLGYGLEPVPALRETVLALDLLHPDDVPADVLTELIAGKGHAATSGTHREPRLTANTDGRIWGTTEPLPDGGPLRLFVTRALQNDGRMGWYTLDPTAPGCDELPGEQLGVPTRRLRVEGVRALPCHVTDATCALHRARIRQAAVLLGLADRALESARAHVNTRIQYGQPLLELQTIAHRLARLVAEAEGWRLLVQEAAWRIDQSCEDPSDAIRALAAATEHAHASTRLGIQLHGVRGMAAHSTVASAYRLASIEALRMGTTCMLWAQTGHAMTAAHEKR
jgi:azi35